MQKKLIAIIEDEPDISELIAINVQKAGYNFRQFENGLAFFDFLKTDKPDLVLLDLMLPDIDGIEICKKIKADNPEIFVIMLTAKSDEFDKVLGLEIGADDYVTKPFSVRELNARIKAVLRRNNAGSKKPNIIRINDNIIIDKSTYTVKNNGIELDLTLTEFKIISLLAENPKRVFSRNEILDYVWGHDKIVTDRTVDVHINNLRQKLESNRNIIKNMRGVGYKLDL